jgi:hypothetical protein
VNGSSIDFDLVARKDTWDIQCPFQLPQSLMIKERLKSVQCVGKVTLPEVLKEEELGNLSLNTKMKIVV